jgi:NitT/TauT family transport system substrate-binding protein
MAAASIAVFCGMSSSLFAQTAITVGHAPIAEAQNAYAAAENGYFVKHGLGVKMLRMGPNSVESLVSGSVQISMVPSTTLLQAVENGIDLVVIAGCGVISPTIKSVAITAHAKSGIQSISDLKGKKVGVPSVGAFLDVIFRRWLQQNKFDPRSIQFIEIAIPNTVDVMRAGQLDAIVAGQPFTSRIEEMGAGKVLSYFTTDLPAGTPYIVFAAMRDYAAKNPQVISGFQKAVREGADFGRSDPAKMKEFVAKYTGQPLEIINRVPAPECKADFEPSQYTWLIDVLMEQGRLSKKLDPAQFVIR